MSAENQDQNSNARITEEEREMSKYGITRSPVDYFHIGKYRYTDLKHAISQARRQDPAR